MSLFLGANESHPPTPHAVAIDLAPSGSPSGVSGLMLFEGLMLLLLVLSSISLRWRRQVLNRRQQQRYRRLIAEREEENEELKTSNVFQKSALSNPSEAQKGPSPTQVPSNTHMRTSSQSA